MAPKESDIILSRDWLEQRFGVGSAEIIYEEIARADERQTPRANDNGGLKAPDIAA